MVKVSDIIEYFDIALPASLSESWDNDGVMVLPEKDLSVSRVLVALDATTRAIAEAERLGIKLIITHHPLIFKPLSSLSCHDPNAARAIKLAKQGIVLLSYHTRLDSAEGGTDDCLAKVLELGDIQRLPRCGRIGTLKEEVTFGDFADFAAKKLGVPSCPGVNSAGYVKKVAVVGGAGKDYIADAKNAGADTFFTGEASHAAMIEAKELGINLILGTHHATENTVLPVLRDLLTDKFPELEVTLYPFMAEDEYGV